MGILSKKPKKNKIYTLAEAMDKVKKYEGYSVVQEENGFKVIPDKAAREHIDRYKERIRQRDTFTSGLKAGYTPNPIEYNENPDYKHRYSYHEDER